MGFLSELRITHTGKYAPDADGRQGNPIYALDDPLAWSGDGGAWTVPAGYETDLASIPLRFQRVEPHLSPAARPGVLHDWFYTHHAVTRREADAIFLDALRAEGVQLLQRLAMWASVRLWGGPAYEARLGWAAPKGEAA